MDMQLEKFAVYVLLFSLVAVWVIIWNVLGDLERRARQLGKDREDLYSTVQALEDSYNRKDFDHNERLQALTTALAEEQKRSRNTINAIELERANWQRRAEQMELQWSMQRDLNIEAREQLAKERGNAAGKA
jgi:biopolymer transport protein ExbB/TolQ